MKRFIMALTGMLALLQAGNAAEAKWLTDAPKALQQAKAEKRLVLLDFTGSDWCPWCIKLDNEVFAKQEFVDYANKNLVPVKVDFPRRAAQSAEQKKANKALQEKYKIEGYPTVVVLNSDGKEVGRLGYEPGGPKAFIAQLDKLKNK